MEIEEPKGEETEAYEPPELVVRGTAAELTSGAVPTTTDGIAPGSIV